MCRRAERERAHSSLLSSSMTVSFLPGQHSRSSLPGPQAGLEKPGQKGAPVIVIH